MKNDPGFTINVRGYSVRTLLQADTEAIQRLFDNCLDFNLLVDGLPVDPDAAGKIFQDLPPGKSLDDKFLWGIFDAENVLAGLLDVVSGYPEEKTWWIGLLLLAPEFRSQHLGAQTVRSFVEYARDNGGSEVMMGVVEENDQAFRFWNKMGFELVSQTEPRLFGRKYQKVNIMRLPLGNA